KIYHSAAAMRKNQYSCKKLAGIVYLKSKSKPKGLSFMNQFVDALGKACPMPVIMAKKEIDAGNTSFVVAVDNQTAVENLKRLAESQGYQASVETKDGNFHVSFTGDGSAVAPAAEETAKPKNWALFIGKNFIGDGSEELGG